MYGAVILPEGLERDVRRGLAPKVLGTYNAAFLLPGAILRRDLRAAFGTLSAGIELQSRQARGESARVAAAHLEPIRVERHTLYNPQLSYLTYLLIPLLPAMLQIFVLVTVVWAVGRELREGTAQEWLEAAGGSATRAVLGKLLPYTAVFVLQLVAMNTLLFTVLGVPLAGSSACSLSRPSCSSSSRSRRSAWRWPCGLPTCASPCRPRRSSRVRRSRSPG